MILNIWVDFFFLFDLLHKIDHLWFYNQKSQFTLLVFHFYCHNSCYVFNVLRMSKYFLYIKTKNSFFPYLYQWMLWEMHMVHKLWFLCISEYERWIGNKLRVWSRAPEVMWTWIPAVCDLKFLCCVGNLDFVRLLRGYKFVQSVLLCLDFCLMYMDVDMYVYAHITIKIHSESIMLSCFSSEKLKGLSSEGILNSLICHRYPYQLYDKVSCTCNFLCKIFFFICHKYKMITISYFTSKCLKSIQYLQSSL